MIKKLAITAAIILFGVFGLLLARIISPQKVNFIHYKKHLIVDG